DLPSAVVRVSPAVVGIRAEVDPDRPSAATLGTARWGSGAIIEADGTVLTVGYLVLEASTVEVVLPDGRTLPARVHGHDFESGLAVVRVDKGGPFPTVALGRSDAARPGQPVSVVGMSDEKKLVARTGTITGARRFVAYWEYLLERALFVAPQHPA